MQFFKKYNQILNPFKKGYNIDVILTEQNKNPLNLVPESTARLMTALSGKSKGSNDDLITDWTNTSKKLLLMLNKKDQISTKNKDPKSLMAFGAMGAHINMAMQALKATEFDQ